MLKKFKIILEMIKFEHTIFALPFAFTGAVLAAKGLPTGRQILWIVAAMAGARSAAMGFNRWADRKFDAENPRTRERALPKGLVTPFQVIVFTVLSSAVLVFAAYMLNPLSFYLSPLALAIVFFIHTPSGSRTFHTPFSASPYRALPSAHWIAVAGVLEPPALVLGGAVLFWLIGFDTLYALQDLDFDKKAGSTQFPEGSAYAARSGYPGQRTS